MYIITSVLSLILTGSSLFIGYRLFNWIFSTGNPFGFLIIYQVWLLITCVLVGINAWPIFNMEYSRGTVFLSHIIAVIWCLSIFAMTIYLWFKQPYTANSIIVRIITTFLSIYLARWTYMLIIHIQSSKLIID